METFLVKVSDFSGETEEDITESNAMVTQQSEAPIY
jgi:hypothetical protein